MCVICHEQTVENEVVVTSCDHSYHSTCLRQWIKQCIAEDRVPDCPLCRCYVVEIVVDMFPLPMLEQDEEDDSPTVSRF